MKLADALKHTGHPFEIPDCSREDLPQFFVDMGFKVGAEIGVERGQFSESLCRAGLTIYAIDPWREQPNLFYERGQKRQDSYYEHTKQRLAPYPNSTIIRKTSMEAVTDFANESLDFVYIDANHEFRYIAEDLVEWTKRVKKGGIVSGHDYFFVKPGIGAQIWHVAHVLHAFTNAYNISNWYVLGAKDQHANEKRDRWRSWMFVKP